MTLRRGLLALAVATAGMHAAAAQTTAPADPYQDAVAASPARTPPWRTIELGRSPYPFPVYTSKNLQQDDLRGIRRLVIIVHGVKRDASRYYDAVASLTGSNPARLNDTLIVAPRFSSSIDTSFSHMPAWRRSGWEYGEPSMAAKGRPAPVGSMQVLDDLLHELTSSARLPALRSVVIAGHSGGAQLVQRYAVLNNLDENLREKGLDVRYVVANPSSYLYLSADRPHADGFAPYERGICPTYNQYKYGLDQLPPFLHEVNRSTLAARYADRQVTYLLGSADNNPEHQSLDKSCGAEAQGATRWARGLGYWRYEQLSLHRHPEWPKLKHDAQEVVGVGHDAAAMFGSTCGARALLGETSAPLPQGAPCLPLAR
ncbi:hypothetical protein [Bordetella avium]|uniref:hypothetical protein n=1 Tax=Bordetella avium TaxID=521 RepID=UPI000E686A6F|nr:hypothetical protein C0J07_12050 [Bordetella avium]RIQ17605.1 hypothetical protein D0850_08990 [Bordetella avium]RIQ32262.1 hypothetical protein D0849_12035 [Bordetella avium]RIQ67758.1 hypothetical protein D0839_12815 [Bordetella avium]